VFNLQDIHPKVLIDSGAVRNPFLKSILYKMEEVCYKNAHSLIAYSEGNRDYIVNRGTNGHVFIIPNWADMNAVVSYDKADSFRNEEKIGNKFIVSYAGTMQQAQGLEIILEAAENIEVYNDIIFLLAGEGTSKPILEGIIKEKLIKNVFIRPVMPEERYKQLLYESDVCLITLSLDTPLQTVPGKLAYIMGYGKPVILAANTMGDAAKVINKAECGYCVDPGDSKAFSKAVLNLYKDEGLRKTMGENARVFAEQNFSRPVCTKQYEEVLFSAMRDGDLHF
jgi:glycosyltransferase involved in cell wall biosynthesis